MVTNERTQDVSTQAFYRIQHWLAIKYWRREMTLSMKAQRVTVRERERERERQRDNNLGSIWRKDFADENLLYMLAKVRVSDIRMCAPLYGKSSWLVTGSMHVSKQSKT